MARYWSDPKTLRRNQALQRLIYYFSLPKSEKDCLEQTAIKLTKLKYKPVRKFTRKEFEVEEIIAHRVQNNEAQLLVKWKGFPLSENTWEPWFNLEKIEPAIEYTKTYSLTITYTSISSPICLDF
jgi:hypothetical protein